jgi:hypothetical protein
MWLIHKAQRPGSTPAPVAHMLRGGRRLCPKSASDAKIPLLAAGLCCGGGRDEGDLVAEALELVHGVAAGTFGVAAGVVIGAGVVIERTGMGHIPDRDQDRVFDRDECFLCSATGGDASVLGGEIGVAGVCDG